MPRRRSAAADRLAMAERRRRVAALYLRGETQAEIASAVGVDQGTVSRDLEALHADWKGSGLIDFGERKGQELARLDVLERVAWQAWERSCQDAEKTVRKRVPAGDGHRVETTHTREGQAGDPRFLERVGWCIDRRCELLGLDPPKKVAPTDPGGDKPYAGSLIDLVMAARAASEEYDREHGDRHGANGDAR